MKNKKGIIVAFIIVAISASLIFLIVQKTKFKFNSDGEVGNTNGNLYNNGLFCEYDGDVYFSNPYDNNSLYKMNMDGTEFEKIHNDNVSYINICNDYIYYKKFNYIKGEKNPFSRALYGISRLKVGGSGIKTIHNGKIDCMTLCGNYIYYRYYDDETLFSLRKVKIDGSEDVFISKEDYAPIAVYNKEIYFTNVKNNHNLLALNTDTDKIRTVAVGNFYLPDINEGNLYFIDLENSRKLTKMNLSTMEKTILSEDKVINYNLSGKYDVIYYQAENTIDEHKLCRIKLDGSEKRDIAEGDYCKINITKKYTYFIRIMGDTEVLYRTPTIGSGEVTLFSPQVIED